MTGHRQVALRAAFWKVDGVKLDLDEAGTASVFADETTATTAVKAAINAKLVANWNTHRKTLAKGTQVKINAAVSVKCVAYTKSDDPVGEPYAESEMPKYIESSKDGERELYPGDYAGAGLPTDANAPDKAEDPLTTGGETTYDHVYAIIDPNKDRLGGWGVYTAYPKP